MFWGEEVRTRKGCTLTHLRGGYHGSRNGAQRCSFGQRTRVFRPGFGSNLFQRRGTRHPGTQCTLEGCHNGDYSTRSRVRGGCGRQIGRCVYHHTCCGNRRAYFYGALDHCGHIWTRYGLGGGHSSNVGVRVDHDMVCYVFTHTRRRRGLSIPCGRGNDRRSQWCGLGRRATSRCFFYTILVTLTRACQNSQYTTNTCGHHGYQGCRGCERACTRSHRDHTTLAKSVPCVCTVGGVMGRVCGLHGCNERNGTGRRLTCFFHSRGFFILVRYIGSISGRGIPRRLFPFCRTAQGVHYTRPQGAHHGTCRRDFFRPVFHFLLSPQRVPSPAISRRTYPYAFHHTTTPFPWTVLRELGHTA